MSAGEIVADIVIFGGAALFIWLIWRMFAIRSNQQKQLLALQATGFKIDHLLDGSMFVAFDDTSRRLAFVAGDNYLLFDYAAIATWNWKWKERNGRHVEDYISFEIRDKACPLMEVKVPTKKIAEFWMAKIRAILET